MKTIMDNLYMAGTIARKDIGEALKNRSTLINLMVMILLVVFFYWISTARPWDKRIDIVVYDEGASGLFSLERSIELSDGYEIDQFEATSFGQMQRNMRYERFGLVIPADIEQTLDSGETPALTGYLLWVYRGKVAELEALYSEKVSELLGFPIRIEIGTNIVVPSPEIGTTMVNQQLIFVSLFVAITLVPALMVEEKLSKTLDALMVSPASAGQIAAGKGLAGMFYVLMTGGLFFALNWAYIYNWGLALLGFLLAAFFSIGLALAVGGLARTPQQLMVWLAPLMIFLILPMTFAGFYNLAPGLKAIFSWIPTTALVNIIKYSFSSSAPVGELLFDLAIVAVSVSLLFAVVVWKVRRSDR